MSTTASPDAFLLFSTSKNQQVSPEKLWATARPKNELGETKIFYNQVQGTPDALTAIVSLGNKFNTTAAHVKTEAVRKAVASGIKQLRDAGAKNVAIDASIEPHAAAVGATLGLYKFTTLRTKESDKNPKVDFQPLSEPPKDSPLTWETGLVYASSQNVARELMELPANIITPTGFTERVKELFKDIPNVDIYVRDEAWAQEKGMRTFLSVSKGTNEPAKFLEIHYHGAASKQAQPLAFVGKGITFDSGGISLKPAKDMKAMRADMGGAATVVASTLAIAKLRLPINLVSVTPLTENLPGPSANKPGDVVYAMNGKTIEIDNTDAEGRLVLADALYYATTTYKPHTVVDVATLTGAVLISLGEIFSGVFSSSDSLWEELRTAGEAEHDRMWRLPLDEEFGPQIRSSNADLCNVGGSFGGSCTAALFLKACVDAEDGKEPPIRWAHIDIGCCKASRAGPYTPTGMTGRPTRALIEFARRLAAN
ncbi:cytosol aminopeptidase family, catalytic domain-containing protein [Hysterangium stoloniferum]|nr:cytosol aminopeptidase family, catalytic domain-containing protein [Hysterangium stoloniferum]